VLHVIEVTAEENRGTTFGWPSPRQTTPSSGVALQMKRARPNRLGRQALIDSHRPAAFAEHHISSTN